MKFKVALAFCAVALGLVLFLFSPYFALREIVITGNGTVSRAEIEDSLDVVLGDNILIINTSAARRRVMENLYIDSVSFERVLPGRLNVTVRERRLVAYIEHTPGSFLFIDETGRVLEVRTFFTEPLPMVTGLQFSSFQLGERLDVPNRAAFGIVTQYAQALQQYGLSTLVTHIDVTDVHNTRILFNQVEFNVGDARDAEEKVRTMAEILNSLPDVASYRGFVDLREIASQYFLTILT
ncbi:MAG: FtsQ-type POTRA domain-containing protein [Defluviitaleaceae bacterium]|nr:FtsQ-type POTRA domain-containing protein [Defluviitaleaceae bacterium]MCL2238323.1 FtsQ-type POTRA domain-containing protein [Defluviitaleaceae bacterium]